MCAEKMWDFRSSSREPWPRRRRRQGRQELRCVHNCIFKSSLHPPIKRQPNKFSMIEREPMRGSMMFLCQYNCYFWSGFVKAMNNLPIFLLKSNKSSIPKIPTIRRTSFQEKSCHCWRNNSFDHFEWVLESIRTERNIIRVEIQIKKYSQADSLLN